MLGGDGSAGGCVLWSTRHIEVLGQAAWGVLRKAAGKYCCGSGPVLSRNQTWACCAMVGRADHCSLRTGVCLQRTAAFLAAQPWMSEDERQELDPQITARYNDCVQCVHSLGSSKTTETNFGSGCAWGEAGRDTSVVVAIRWYTAPLKFGGKFVRMLGCHSVVAVQVRGVGVNANAKPKVYVLEKAENSKYNDSGILVSPAEDFSDVLEFFVPGAELPPQWKLHGEELEPKAGLTMTELIEAATGTGQYHVSKSNCHVAAEVVWKKCSDKPKSRPNRIVTSIAGQLQSSPYSNGSGQSQGCYSYEDPGTFMLKPNDAVPGTHHSLAEPCLRLSKWIYRVTEADHPLPPPLQEQGMSVELLSLAGDQGKYDGVQWAIVRDDRQAGTIFVVFKGTDRTFDILTDLGANVNFEAMQGVGKVERTKALTSGIGVHSGMWSAMSSANVYTRLVSSLEAAIKTRQFAGSVVICGHSLGGGYATLATLKLCDLHPYTTPMEDGTSIEVGGQRCLLQCVTFGCPQVVVQPEPEANNQAWSAVSISSWPLDEGDVELSQFRPRVGIELFQVLQLRAEGCAYLWQQMPSIPAFIYTPPCQRNPAR